jgi:aspartyl protease family protein
MPLSLPTKHFMAAIVWVALFAGVYFVIDATQRPKVATVIGNNEIQSPRSRDGHFYVPGAINGQPVTFMVDTGASTVSVGYQHAQRLGLPRGRQVMVGTANGYTQAEEVLAQTVSVGDILIRDVRIVILPNNSGEPLLGQNVLKHLDILQSQELMTLKPRRS